ncbi:MAG TPA: hypothetical protein VF692_00505 [Pyrinomonadaceae bacterium]|jgi:hypothetical protein
MDISQITNLFQIYLTPDGVQELLTEIRSYKKQYGEKWLNEFKLDYPDFVEIIDLIANHNAPDAYLKFKEMANNHVNATTEGNNFLIREATRQGVRLFIEQNQSQIFNLHATLRRELDKPRF